MMNNARPVGEYLREWRQRRRLSQLDLALDAEISTRHLSFMETGRSTPGREMVLRLAALSAFPAPHAPGNSHAYAGAVVPLQLMTDAGTLSFISTTTVFGTQLDVTLWELALESFFPADAQTADALRRHAAASIG